MAFLFGIYSEIDVVRTCRELESPIEPINLILREIKFLEMVSYDRSNFIMLSIKKFTIKLPLFFS